MSEQQLCLKCQSECSRDEVDVGVGMIYGPWGCPNCGWSSDPAYDHSQDTSPRQIEYPDWYVDQWGDMVRRKRLRDDFARLGLDPNLVDEVF